MAGPDYVVAGAGPAGAAAAARLARRGYRVVVYEAQERLAVKPCGLGVPSAGDLPVRVPRDVVLADIRGARLYVDGELAVEVEGYITGFIVDKESLLESAIVESGAELVRRARYDPARRAVKTPSGNVDVRAPVILAGGWPYYRGERIAAVQVHARARGVDPDFLEIWFDTGLIGYYWIFPLGDSSGTVEVGVGGYADPRTLARLLERFMDMDERITTARGPLKGAMIAVGGLRLGTLGDAVLAGEAAGFVLPLTGEGIRPSMISGAAAAEALAEGRDPVRAQAETGIARAIRVHRRILEAVKSMERVERRRLLASLPGQVHAEVALGTLRKHKIMAALASRPRLAAKLLKLLGPV